MWGILKTDQYERRLKRYEKKKNKLGDKATQPADIEDCKSFVKQIREKAHGGSVHDHESGREEKERGKDS